MANPDSHDERLVRLETAVAHLQHDFERLHQVALDLQSELRQWTRQLTRLERLFEQLESPPDQRSAADERPPHY